MPMFDYLLETEGFPPRWNCGSAWADEPWLGWLHIGSDATTFLAYLAIPVLMLAALRRQERLPAPRLAALFAIFILACGSVHLIEVIIFWKPVYRLSAVAKLITAISSCMTVAALAVAWPRLLAYRGPDELQAEVDQKTDRLAELNERLSLALSAGAMGAWDWDLASGEVRFDATQVALTGMSGRYDNETGETIVRAADFFELVHEEDRPGLEEAVAIAKREGTPYSHAFRMRTPDGVEKWLTGRGRVVKERGKAAHFVGVNFDVSQQKLAEQELAEARRLAEAASEAKSRFLANTSHEIRTPLTAILGCAETLTRDAPDEETAAVAGVIQRQGQLLQTLLNDVLDLSKIEAGRLTVQTNGVCDVASLLEDIRSLMQPMATQKGLAFELKRDKSVPEFLRTDPNRVRQIIVNLVSNAIKFTDSGRVELGVEVERRADSPIAVFSVTDTGRGIPPNRQAAVFAPFYQVHAPSESGGPTHSVNIGAGLGLAIASRFADCLGGELSVHSEVGKGSRFELRLPAEAPDAARLASYLKKRQSLLKQAATTVSRRGAVLVAEDTPSIQFLIRRVLTRHATRLDFVADGQAVVDRVSEAIRAKNPYNAILLDMNMPVMSGYEAARQIRSRGVKTPIIALTASAMVGDRERCLEAGCTAYVPKPIDLLSLEAEVQAAFAAQNLPLDRPRQD